MKKNGYSPYSGKLCRKALLFVFSTLVFDDINLKQIICDSYFLNLGIMREYARDNGIDEMSYILGIHDELLKSGTAHER